MHAAFGDHDWLDVEAGHELHVVKRENIRRIDHGEGQRRADARERQHRVLLHHLLGNEAQHRRIDIEQIEIDRRDAVVSGKDGSNHVVADETELDEIETEAATVLALVVESLSQALRANKIFAYENFA